VGGQDDTREKNRKDAGEKYQKSKRQSGESRERREKERERERARAKRVKRESRGL